MTYHKSKRHKSLKRDKDLQNKFGINLPTYDRMFEEQDGKCAICGDVKLTLAVDHCHKTGKVRGLLCNSCNNGLGRFKDRVDFLRKAIEYLEREYILQPEDDIPRKSRAEYNRFRNVVTTPDGVFPSYTDAAKFYEVHPTTVGAWCGDPKYTKRNPRIREGFKVEYKQCMENEIEDNNK